MVLQGQDAWRAHPVFKNLWRHAFPGFRIGALAFGAYVVVSGTWNLVSPPKPHGAHIGHGSHGDFGWARPNPGALPSQGDDDDDDE